MKPGKLFLIRGTLFLTLLFVAWSCENSQKLEKRNWELVWQDDFNANGAPDPAKWTYDIGAGGWGNNELQVYTSDAENIVVEDSVLKITAIRKGNSYTSARIKTQGLFEQAYGRFEARIQLPWGPGIWPAFWLLGSDNETVGWPQCGEIDIMEYRGQQPNIIHGSLHGPGYSGGSAITKSWGYIDNRFDLDFHVFAVEWGSDYIDYYVDDILYQEIKPDDLTGEWVFDQPFFIILNVAVGGNYVGFPTSETPFPQSMIIDWVRVYREAE
jgi:beta-glucanase (GH16 family)